MMAFEQPYNGTLDYHPCRYGKSRQVFRGPETALDAPYAAFLGGAATYGRFVETPFPDLVAAQTGCRTVNLGCVNAGIDVYVHDEALLEIAQNAHTTVIQVMGAQNMSNRFYTVHPRRNDRFIRPSDAMTSIFPGVDFTEFAFTRHLLTELHQCSRHQFRSVADELKAAWVARMKLMIERIGGNIVLLWVANHRPLHAATSLDAEMSDPAFIDRTMIDEIRPLVDEYVEIVPDSSDMFADTTGMIFSELEAAAAVETPGLDVHRDVAEALAPRICRFMTWKGGPLAADPQ